MFPWVEALKSVLPAVCFRDSDDDKASFGRDWTKHHEPAPSVVVLPGSVEEVQAVMRVAYEHEVAVVPSGGRTGLSGGAVAANGEIVLALDRMNQILDYNAIDRQVRVQAGVVTQALQEFAEQQGLFYPVDFASAGSSQIGGNIATNAGGIKVIRYGMTRQWVQGLKVVLADGRVIDANQGLYKNATGYDLRHLMIGSEGTLGVVVEAQIQLTSQPHDPQVVVLGVPSMAAVMEVMQAFRAQFELNAFEFFSKNALAALEEHRSITRPFETDSEYYVLLEMDKGEPEHADIFEERLMAVFETVMEAGLVEDGVISQSTQQAQDLWVLREGISESIAPKIPYKNDISVLPSKVPEMLKAVEEHVNKSYAGWEIVWFGHIGDGNLHLNILKPADMEKADFFKACHGVTHDISAIIKQLGGSVSAEHGVGLLKKEYLGYSRSEDEVQLMKLIKQAFDPKGIMNPGKVFDL
ncbi:MAG TPA: FAD-binding oxidoreductase [Gammaproteobacteria bacterium]|nr:FAD-binding oxidoreductase [Gammaproteobacteria bacterium]MEC8011317.1 FAD-binding oxidoreductase [Pseudomonadota bacterium]HBF07944.1 FAD-binding oxidoreductase [Gammaproteobacteria bacterium]HCK94342.1 FAD-binding oxidoreductase [Gammaproteobacteria bacterium]|tara:strand:+ start:5754 stop:7154 length:1401 start_codon:yes stop_codon:yes gene_type:complete